MPEVDFEDKIQKLMALAENESATPEEREAFMERAMFLMAKYGLEYALENKNKPEEVITVKCRIDNPYKLVKDMMLNCIATAFGCRLVNTKTTYIMYGYQGDIERSLMLYGSLVIQMQTGLAAAVKPPYIHGKTFNAAWTKGYVATVNDRVRRAYLSAQDDVRQSAGTGMELVLFDRRSKVEAAVIADHAILVHRKVNYIANETGFQAGRQAGYQVDIGQTSFAGGRSQIE